MKKYFLLSFTINDKNLMKLIEAENLDKAKKILQKYMEKKINPEGFEFLIPKVEEAMKSIKNHNL